jgi:hypothetical protein
MDLTLTKINGTHRKVDYNYLKNSIISILGQNAKDFEILILNAFPIAVSTKNNLDLLIFIKNRNTSNKVIIEKKYGGFVYVTNLILAVSILDEFIEDKIFVDDRQNIETENYIFDFVDEASKLKWGLTNYLANISKLNREKISVHPLFWIMNSNQKEVAENIIISNQLDFSDIFECIGFNENLRYPGYNDWNYSPNYNENIRQIIEKASLDSDLGYITKNKINRIQKKLDDASEKAYNEIGEKLVEVRGKAGTGKSSDLIKWLLKRSLLNERATFLTYNNLLVFDVSRLIRSFENSLSEDEIEIKQPTSVNTIHSFMFNLSKKLGITLLMSIERFNELNRILEHRLNTIKFEYNNYIISNSSNSIYDFKNFFQNNTNLDKGTKEEAINFINKFNLIEINDEDEVFSKLDLFKTSKIKLLQENLSSKMFLQDYHGVLKNILLALTDVEKFVDNFDITDNYKLLEIPLKLNESFLSDSKDGKINRDKIITRYKKSISHFGSNRKLYIDEAQDCHSLEKDIFIRIFGYNNIIISSGGKEQLIRYSQVCNWEISQNKNVPIYRYNKKRKSYRLKPAIASLVNHIGNYFDIDLNIEALETSDHGSIIIDKSGINPEKRIEITRKLMDNSNRFGCSTYESLILFKNAADFNDQAINETNLQTTTTNLTVNENNVIFINKKNRKNEWPFITELNKTFPEIIVWNATGNVDKKSQSVPGSLSLRTIYYESSRGLEAWSTMSFDLDGFFENKKNEEEADSFLLTEIMDNETRKNKYAATWVLMALTRAIDTSYIELNSSENILSKCLDEFINKYPHYVEIINQ